MAEEWVKDARSVARLVDNLHAETSKALANSEHKNEFTTKLAAEDRGRKSTKAGLKNA